MNRVKLNGFPNFCRKMIACSGERGVLSMVNLSQNIQSEEFHLFSGIGEIERELHDTKHVTPSAEAVCNNSHNLRGLCHFQIRRLFWSRSFSRRASPECE